MAWCLKRESFESQGCEGVCKQEDGRPLRMDLIHRYTQIYYGESRPMVLIYESDPLDNDDARGRFYHVCRGRIDRTEIQLPVGEKVYECAVCGIDLEAEDFWLARQKGSV